MFLAKFFQPKPDDEKLLLAIKREDVCEIERQLDLGANVEVEDKANPDNNRPLHYAAKQGDVELGELLLKHNAKTNVANSFKEWTPLHLAARHGYYEFVTLLLEHNAFVDSQDRWAATPLQLALELRRRCININQLQEISNWKSKLLTYVIQLSLKIFLTTYEEGINKIENYDKVIKILIEHGASVDLIIEKWSSAAEKARNMSSPLQIPTIERKDIACLVQVKNNFSKINKLHIKELLERDYSKPLSLELFSKHVIETKHLVINPKNINIFKTGPYIKFLADLLVDNKTVVCLTLNDCNIGDEGLLFLSVMLEKNTTLSRLNLERNNITDKGVSQLAKSLKINRTLKGINLHYNCIFDKGAIALADMIRKNYSIIHIDLSSNPTGKAGLLAVTRALQKRGNKTGTVNLTDPAITVSGEWNVVTLYIWNPEESPCCCPHAALQTYGSDEDDAGYYMSFWPSRRIGKYDCLQEVTGHFSKNLAEDEEIQNDQPPDYTILIPHLDIHAIENSFRRIKELGKNVKFKLLGDSKGTNYIHNCCSFCLCLLRSGCNHEVIDPIYKNMRIRDVKDILNIVHPMMIKKLAENLREIQLEKHTRTPYMATNIYPWNGYKSAVGYTSIFLFSRTNNFRTRVPESGAQTIKSLVEADEKKDNSPPSRFN